MISSSIATCAGYYVLNFCRTRDIPDDGIHLEMRSTRSPDTRLIDQVEIEIVLPDHFPAKYEKAVIRAAQLCSVKKHLENGIEFATTTKRVCT